MLLLASLTSWIIFTLPLGFIQPPATSCIIRYNSTTYELKSPEMPVARVHKRSINIMDDANLNILRFPRSTTSGEQVNFIDGNNNMSIENENQPVIKNSNENVDYTSVSPPLIRVPRGIPPIFDAGISPIDVSYTDNFKSKLHSKWVSPLFSSIVYTTSDIQKAFFLLILLIIIGEFFAAPAITLADSAVITLLGEDTDKYGHQRMFGSLGWGLAMFFVGK